MSEREVVYAIIPLLPDRINAIHLHTHQDKVKRRKISTLPEQPNDLAEDSKLSSNLPQTKRNYMFSIPFVSYHNGQHIANDH